MALQECENFDGEAAPHTLQALQNITPYHAKLFAHELTRQAPPGADDQLSMSLFDASVDLNPHQIEAAMFAMQSPLSEGVILADEVGLGKTIEAGIVICQKWAEHKRKLLVACPASLRKQWALEIEEKFNIPAMVIDAKTYRAQKAAGNPRPFEQKAVVVASYHYVARMQDDVRMVPWDLVTIDEAHKLRNAYRPGNKIGQAVRWATEGRRKLLLTATPLQNSLMELYGLATLIDENIFGDSQAFRAKYATTGGDLDELRYRLNSFCKRTLRRDVLEYVRYTERRALTHPFRPTDDEHRLYEAVSEFLQRSGTYSLPHSQRHLTVLLLRKLLASSPFAIASTLETMQARLEKMRDGLDDDADWAAELIEREEMEEDIFEELLDIVDSLESKADDEEDDKPDPIELRREIDELGRLAGWARAISTDSKAQTLLTGLDKGFSEMGKMGAAEKALIFTESRRTQDYLKRFLERNGYDGQVFVFNGTNGGPEVKEIYDRWVAANRDNGRATGSRPIDVRTALIDHFRDRGKIMIATEAAGEGVNLQFCSLVVNYDLPWNPQRIEQRIGRCHRYGQQHDVIVINFLNERNEADQRVHDLLRDKFSLFDGIFGASDEVLGALDSGVDFEKRILAIYQECRTAEEIEAAFNALQRELEEQISKRMEKTRQALLEHFDEDVHARLRLRLEDTKAQLDQVGKRFWAVTRHILDGLARFDEDRLAFDLLDPPGEGIRPGRYHLISKTREKDDTAEPGTDYFLYRLSHPLGEHVIDSAKSLPTPGAELTFNLTSYPGRIALVETLKGKSGYLTLNRLTVQSFEQEEYLLFSGIDDDGHSLAPETCLKLFNTGARIGDPISLPHTTEERLAQEAEQHRRAALNRAMEANNAHFNAARERLEMWAEDKIATAEKALRDTKEQIKALRRDARRAETLEEQNAILKRLKQAESKQNLQRRDIFKTEDEIEDQRDQMIAAIEKRLSQDQWLDHFFTIRWHVV